MASAQRLNQLLTAANSPPLTEEQGTQFTAYLTLLQKWNARTNLAAIRDEVGILSRHFLGYTKSAMARVPSCRYLCFNRA